MKQKHSVTIEIPNTNSITLSSSSIARQANGAITIQMGETVVFVSVTAATKPGPGQTFFPLLVEYKEKFFAAGRFPGGYFKREGRPSEKEILTARLCDRPLRPLFPKGFINDVQVVGYLLAADIINEPDVLMVNGASAALMCSDIPWNGPIGCVRVGEVDGQFIINPTNEQSFQSSLDLVYVGTETDMLMIEGNADQISEERFIEALEFAHKSIQPIIEAQKELARQVHKSKRIYPMSSLNLDIKGRCKAIIGSKLSGAAFKSDKIERETALELLKEEATAILKQDLTPELFDEHQIQFAFERLVCEIYRNAILDHNKRIDGRGITELRTIRCETGVLPRVHGSAIFERGETQSIIVTTLGTSRDAQDLDALSGGAQSKSFILHYNFPPFSVGEVGRYGATGRREIGHGALAERSILPVVPTEDIFPYAIRVVSEIMESNGSTSMASVCGGSLALMDAGVPLSSHVAGISTGLVTRHDEAGTITQYVILTDILGSEDHYGDMDFKIAGTTEGITGFQLDLKIQGLPLTIAKEAIYQNRKARLQILEVMQACLPEARSELREHAPRVHQMKISPEKIGLLIGPGGKNIKRISEISNAKIDINEDNSGRIIVYANSQESLQRAIDEIELIASDIEVGKIYRARVRTVKDFGAFVECLPGKEGLVHISELAECPIKRVEDVCKVGDEVIVKCVGIDDQGRVRLSRRAFLIENKNASSESLDSKASAGSSCSDGRSSCDSNRAKGG